MRAVQQFMQQTDAREMRDAVLLIDDDQFIAGCLRQYLIKDGWDVDVATDRAAAEEQMHSRQYGVVLVDPYLTGPLNENRAALLSVARNLQPDAAMVVITAYSSPEMQRTASACGAAALLSKPQSVLTLCEAIASASQRRLEIKKGSRA